MRSNYKALGKYIQPIDIRNTDLKVETLLGVSIRKVLMPSIANTVGTDMRTYKIIKKNQFAYGPVTSRNGNKISVALLDEQKEAIVSQAYTVFEVIDEFDLHPEYLMMWFRRPEFDRYARFKSHGSAREIFGWEEMCETELPVPSIEKQLEIVAEYNTIQNRIKLNEQLNQKLEETAQAIYSDWFVEFEFPDENGKPYKSNGGEMVFNEKLDKKIPEGWEVKPLVTLAKIKGGKRMPLGESLISIPNQCPYIKVADMGNFKFVILNEKFEFVPEESQTSISRYLVSKNDLIISIVGTIGVVKIIQDSLHKANLTENCIKVTSISKITSSYLYHYLRSKNGREEIEMRNVGAVQAKLPIYNIESLPILCPLDDVNRKFQKIIKAIDESIINSQIETKFLKETNNLILAKMTKVEFEKEIA